MKLPIELYSSPGRRAAYGVPDGEQARVLSVIAAAGKGPVLFVARDGARLAQTEQALGFFAADLPRLDVPAWDCLPYDRVSPNGEICARRMSALSRLAAWPGGPLVVLTTVNALVQRLPDQAMVTTQSFHAAVGGPLDRAALIDFLDRTGFNRVGTVIEPGEYAVRGGLFDLFPPGAAEPLRLDLFGDVLEGLRRFDPVSQRSTGRETALTLVPASEFLLDRPSIERFRLGYRHAFGAVTDEDPLYQAVSAGRRWAGMEHWLPLFHDRLATLFDYLPDAPVALDHLAEEARDERLAMIDDFYQARRATASATDAEPPYKALPPHRLYLSAAEWEGHMNPRAVAVFSPFAPPEPHPGGVDLGGRAGRDFAADRAKGGNVYDALAQHVGDLRRGQRRVVIATFSRGSRERLAAILADHGVDRLVAVDSHGALDALPAGSAGIAVLALEHGFESPDLAVIGEQDILGDRLVRPRRARRADDWIAAVSQLAPGDLVVHVDHGIGRFTGLRAIDVAGAPHDCLALLYEGGDRLYLPVENIELLSRYGAADAAVALDKLGGAAWQGRKARLKRRLKDMAEELIRIAARRAMHRIEPIQPPAGAFDEFCSRFPYDETDDQAKAIDDALSDLAGKQPMDRLICGDVGFGKTEVALRAAFAVALDARQVAMVCPTTLLCRQHHAVFTARFHGLPVRVEQLSRLVPSAKASAIKHDLARGAVDIVIGTHALLGKSVVFKNIGLMIVDEEQRFGVRHKERLKQLAADIHVLTLTATPIPRTLQLALSGVRDMSIIATPPVDRLAVRTTVVPFDPLIVREALMREHGRGGQSFYVCPRIEDLTDAADSLRRHVPEVRFGVAHGRLAARELEAVMTAFYDHRIDVLICTDIVESGLDIPAANTLIVHRADMFGLAQLYQLRGRIGRSKLRAFAYFTLPPGKGLTANAAKRLRVLQAMDTLGAGFTLASHDLDIRGAGNLLGEEQSGHINEVGVELYQEMLAEAVAAGQGTAAAPGADKWSPQIALGAAVLIPEAYVADLDLRMQLYRRMAQLESRPEVDAFATELIDRFGPLPSEVNSLLDIVLMKRLCRDIGVEKVEAGPRGLTLAFRHNRIAHPERLVAFIQRRADTAKLRADHRLVVRHEWPDAAARLPGVLALLEDLAATLQTPRQPVAVADAPAASRAARSKA